MTAALTPDLWAAADSGAGHRAGDAHARYAARFLLVGLTAAAHSEALAWKADDLEVRSLAGEALTQSRARMAARRVGGAS